MKYVIAIIFLLASVVGKSQTKIDLADISKHIGDSVTVEGKIFGVRYIETAKDAPTLINVGGQYPDQLLTIVIYGLNRKDIKEIPTQANKGDIAIVTGKVELYKEKPQIVIRMSNQLSVASGKAVSPAAKN